MSLQDSFYGRIKLPFLRSSRCDEIKRDKKDHEIIAFRKGSGENLQIFAQQYYANIRNSAETEI